MGAIDNKLIGDKHEIQECVKHDGWYRILRDATNAERFAFYVYGYAATARKTNRTLGDVLRMHGSDTEELQKASGARYEESTLF